MDSPGLAELKSKLNVKSRPSSGAFIKNKNIEQKFNIVNSYSLEDEQERYKMNFFVKLFFISKYTFEIILIFLT